MWTSTPTENSYLRIRQADRRGIAPDPQPHVDGLACWCGSFVSGSVVVHRNSEARADLLERAEMGEHVARGGRLD